MRAATRIAVFCMMIVLSAWTKPVAATSTLAYGDADYDLVLEIGHDETAVVASVTFTGPEGTTTVLRGNAFSVSLFDAAARRLELAIPAKAPHVPGITLSVTGDEAILVVGGETRHHPFSWAM